MKVFNVILSILVLILALALAVSSYFLYEKREMMLNGWEKLSTSIHETAKLLDNKSATANADKLSLEALAHTKYSELDPNLKVLVEFATAINQQRDQYIEAMLEVGRIVEMSNLPTSAKLSGISTSGQAAQDIKNGVYTFKGKRDALVNAINRTSSLVGVRLNVAELKKGDASNALKALDNKLNSMKTQINNYNNANREIAQYVGVKLANVNDVNATKKSLDEMKRALLKLKNDYNTSQRNLNNANNTIKSLQNTVKGRDAKIASLNKVIADRNSENGQLKVIIGMDNDNVVTPWLDGSSEARKVVKGEVTEINKKFGFAIINIGQNTRVQQRLGNKIGLVDPKIEKGLKFNVVRNLDTPDIKVIASDLVAAEVSDQCTIIELSLEAIKDIKVGDTVIIDLAK